MAKQIKRYKQGKEVTRGSVMGPNDFKENPGNYDTIISETMRVRAPESPNGGLNFGSFRSPVGKTYGLEDIPIGDGSLSFGLNPRNGGGVGARLKIPFKKGGGTIKKMAKGGSTASKRADGCATKGKTKGRFV